MYKLPAIRRIKEKKIVIFTSMIGNIIEFFDFTLYAIFVPLFAKKFFPSDSALLSLFIGLAAFAVAFIVRPFGAILLGNIGDKFGRRIALIFSILFMGIATSLIGLLPVYESIGIISPIALIACRLLQGISLGGELTSSSIFLTEFFNKKKGLAAGITLSSVIIGALLATFIGHLVTRDSAPDYAWRLPFIIGGLLAGIGIYFRIIVEETPEYIELINKNVRSTFPLKEMYRKYLYEFILTSGICAYAGAISYVLLAYITLHLTSFLNYPLSEAIYVNLYGVATMGISSVFFGNLSDKIGSAKLLFYSAMMGVILSVPSFFLIQLDNRWCAIIANIIIGLLAGSYCSAQLVFIAELFPAKIRCSSVSLGHATGLAILGGTFPFITFYLINHYSSPSVAGLYLAFCSFIGLISVTLSIIKINGSYNVLRAKNQNRLPFLST